MIRIYFVRGPSGVGKSTLGREIAKKWNMVQVEVDQYFMKDGQYKFSVYRLAAAHEWAREQVRKAVKAGKSVVVSNTSTRIGEVDQYLEGIDGADVVVIDLHPTGKRAKYKNVHGTPAEKVDAQRERFAKFPEDRITGSGHWPDGSVIAVEDGEAYEIAARSE